MKRIAYCTQSYLWLLPFFSFLGGYFLLYYYLRTPSFTVPSLIGKNIHDAIIILSQYKLSPRILAQKEEPALPEGTILRQVPTAGQTIKPQQPIFLVTAKKQPMISAPQVINKSIEDITRELATNNIRFKTYYLPTNYPEKHCFSQFPIAGQPLENNYLLVYLSTGNNRPIIWPDFTQRSVEEVIEFLADYQIKPQIVKNTIEENKIPEKIIEQQPLAGSLLFLEKTKPLFVQLRIG